MKREDFFCKQSLLLILLGILLMIFLLFLPPFGTQTSHAIVDFSDSEIVPFSITLVFVVLAVFIYLILVIKKKLK